MRTTTVFRSGNSQTVRIPADLAFATDKVMIELAEGAVDSICATTITNALDDEVAIQFGHLRAHQRARGEHIGANVTWIAAEALRHDQTVVTANTSEFCRVPGLRVENWLE